MDDNAQENRGRKPRWSASARTFFVLLMLAALFPFVFMLKSLSTVEMDWFYLAISVLAAASLVMDFRQGTASFPRTSMNFRRSDQPVGFWFLTVFSWMMLVFLFVMAVGALLGWWKF